MRKLPFALVPLALALPSLAHAASFKELTASIVTLVNTAVVPLIYSIAFILFLIGMVRFFFLGGEEGREKGKAFMLWGIIGFVVMFSVWGIVRLLLTALPG
jgi:heme/copper-type cytochrome/quinol oxidase subunit 4